MWTYIIVTHFVNDSAIVVVFLSSSRRVFFHVNHLLFIVFMFVVLPLVVLVVGPFNLYHSVSNIFFKNLTCFCLT